MASNVSHHCGHSPQGLVVRILPPVMIIEIILGLPGNTMALWIFCRVKRWKPNILFLFNLLVADFLLIVCLPFRADYLMRGEDWIYGNAWCSINLFMISANRSGSIAFMTIVAVDRFFKVVYPHHRVNRMTLRQAGVLVAMTWTVVIGMRLPLLTTKLMTETNDTALCRSFDSYKIVPPAVWLHQVVYLAEFFLPLLLLIFCSSRIALILRNRQLDKVKKVRRAIRTILVIVFVFVLCFMPGIVTGLTTLAIKAYMQDNCWAFNLFSQLFILSIGFTYLNSTLDPLIYCFSSSIFRNTLQGILSKMGFVQFHRVPRDSKNTDS